MKNLLEYSEIQQILEIGKKKSIITLDEINKLLPKEIIDEARIDDVLILLKDEKIEVKDDEDLSTALNDIVPEEKKKSSSKSS